LLAVANELKPVYLMTGGDRPKIDRALARLRARFQTDALERLSAATAGGDDAVAACNALVIALGLIPGVALPVVLAVSGLAIGVTYPSRDLIVRAATPPGATGRIYGFVYSGLDLGSLATPVPTPTRMATSRATVQTTCWLRAPSATRIPISRDRRDTAKATTA